MRTTKTNPRVAAIEKQIAELTIQLAAVREDLTTRETTLEFKIAQSLFAQGYRLVAERGGFEMLYRLFAKYCRRSDGRGFGKGEVITCCGKKVTRVGSGEKYSEQVRQRALAVGIGNDVTKVVSHLRNLTLETLADS